MQVQSKKKAKVEAARSAAPPKKKDEVKKEEKSKKKIDSDFALEADSDDDWDKPKDIKKEEKP